MKKYDEFDKEKTTSMDAQEVGNENGTETTAKVNPKDKASALIERELAKKGVPHTENEVEDAIDALYAAYEADGTVPTREAFAEQCADEAVGDTVVAMKRDPFAARKLGKGGVAAICAGCALAIALIGGGVWYTVASQPQDAHDTGSAVVSATEKKDAVGQDKADDIEKADGQGSDAEDKAKDENSQTDGQATDTASQDDGGKGASGSDGSTANNGGGGNTGSASKPSGGSTGSTGGNGGGGSTQTQQPTHTHNWVPVTTTVHHDAVYKTVHHDAVTQERHICNGCGQDITGNENAHMDAAMLAGNTACGAYHSEWKTVQQAYDEQVLVSGAWDETVTTGYKCSTCGATK